MIVDKSVLELVGLLCATVVCLYFIYTQSKGT